jgi:hypothetical protein
MALTISGLESVSAEREAVLQSAVIFVELPQNVIRPL